MILYDNQIFNNQVYGGISRMFAEILQYMHDRSVEFEIPSFFTKNKNLISKNFYKRDIWYGY